MNIFRRLEDIPAILYNYFTVFYMGKERYYQVFVTVKSFVALYRQVPIGKRHYYEVIRKNRRKFILDIDNEITIDQLYDLQNKLKYILGSLHSDIYPITFSSCSNTKTSYHMVIPELEFSIEQCKKIVSMIDPYGYFCDRSVYKRNQLFRIEGSTKYLQNRYKYLFGRNEISDDIHRGLVYSSSKEINVPYKHKDGKYFDLHTDTFKIRRQVSENLISLTRLRPSFCELCKRVHDNENAYLYKRNNIWSLNCFRYDIF